MPRFGRVAGAARCVCGLGVAGVWCGWGVRGRVLGGVAAAAGGVLGPQARQGEVCGACTHIRGVTHMHRMHGQPCERCCGHKRDHSRMRQGVLGEGCGSIAVAWERAWYACCASDSVAVCLDCQLEQYLSALRLPAEAASGIANIEDLGPPVPLAADALVPHIASTRAEHHGKRITAVVAMHGSHA